MWKQIVDQTQTYAATSNRQTQYGSTLLLQDAAGNLTAYGSKLFSYDSANRMSMAVVGSTTTTYRYNGLGQRTTKLATTGGNTVVTHYDYDKDGKYLGQVQLNPDGTYAQGDDYIWLDDKPIAQVHTTYGINNAIASQQLTYIHADHLNTPRAMTDSTKKIVWKWESEAYGRNAPNSDPDGDTVLNRLDLRFPGQIADQETGFYYNMNRYYDPVTGRYTQSDPIGVVGGLNTYAYVDGNPISNIDPLGLMGNGPAGSVKYSPKAQPKQESCDDEKCKWPITITWTTGLPGSPIQPAVTKTYSGQCLATLGLVVKGSSFAASTYALDKAPAWAAGQGLTKTASGLSVARAFGNSPPAIVVSAVVATEAVLSHCECKE